MSGSVPVGCRLALLGLLVLLPVCAAAQDASAWRHWVPADGTQESYTRTVAVYPGGPVVLRHGLVKQIDLLDGYRVTAIPESRVGTDWVFATAQPAFALSTGEAWTVEENALKQFAAGRWVVRAQQHDGERMLTAIPAAPDRIMVLFADRLAAFDSTTSQMRPVVYARDTSIGEFRSMVRGFSGELWVAAAGGVGRLDAAGRTWTALPQPGLEQFERPQPAGDGELLVSARTPSGGYVLLGIRDGVVRTLFTSRKTLRGWRGPDDELWILEGTTIWTMRGDRREPVDKRGPLSGAIYHVASEPGGAFWIASSIGVARHAAALWRTPAAVAAIDQSVHGITEDGRGRIWFAATEYLLELDGGTWRVHPLPNDIRTQTVQTSSLAALESGLLAFTALEQGTKQRLMTFDPRTRTFARVTHPEGRELIFAWKRSDASAWVLTSGPCALQQWNGRAFVSIPGLSLEPLCERVRYIHAASDGSLWVGTTGLGGGVHRPRRPQLELFGREQGYPEAAVYAIFEPRPGRILAGGRESLAEFDGSRWRQLRAGMDGVRTIMRGKDGVVWVASGSGVHRRAGDIWFTNGEADGLRSDIAYNVFEDSRGRIWAGTSRGVSLYFPDADRDAPRAAVAASNPVETPPDGMVSLAFSGIDRWKHTVASRLLYSYRFDGGPWTAFTTETTAQARGLSRGAHRFAVRAMDRNGNIGPVDTFAFAVAFPWYQQSGFYAIASLGLTAIALLVWFLRLQYQQLVDAKQVAESASRAKTEFLANMSHEIRTPMNAIIGMTDLAAEMATNAEQRDCLQTVQTASASLLALLNDILDLSKVEAGKLKLAAESFDLRRCVEDAAGTLRLRAAEKDLEVRLSIAPDVPRWVRGDDLRLRQILLNLLGNAIKFTHHGFVLLRVVAESHGDGIRVRFTVADTGIGVAAEQQRLVFAPFEQGDHATMRRYGGTGLGLAISRRLVDLMRGRIWLESPWTNDAGETVRGTAFHFTAAFGEGVPAPAIATPVDLARATGPLRVLVADDNQVNQTLTRRLLQKLDHTVMLAENGAEAVRLFDQERPDLVLMDVQMPVMDGFEATAAIRAREQESGGHTPIVALTAHALQGYREHCLAAGMDDYLTKPIKLTHLALAIARMYAPAAAAASNSDCRAS